MSAGHPAPDYGSHFGSLAARYDELRSGPSDDAIETLVREGDLRGRGVRRGRNRAHGREACRALWRDRVRRRPFG